MQTSLSPIAPPAFGLFVAGNDHVQALRAMYIASFGFVFFLLMIVIFKPAARAHRLAAFGFVIADIVLCAPRENLAWLIEMLVLPLGLIWFSDLFSQTSGKGNRGGYIDPPTPGWIVAGFGWMLILCASGYIVYNVFHPDVALN